MAVRLFIGNLSYDVTEAELRAHFDAVGPLSALALPMDRDTGKPRGFAFVEFRERTDAEEAIRRFNAQQFKGRPLAVSEALERDARSAPGAPRPSTPRSSTPRPNTPRPASPRPPSLADSSSGEDDRDRDFGPDALPRRRRQRTKRAPQAELRPKHPVYKRTAGPVRFNIDDDDDDDDDDNEAGGN